jgi:predicted phage terminase large subunit-like protein
MLEPQQREELLREKLRLTRDLLVADDRERLTERFRDYVPEAWKILEPGREFVPNWHIDIICEYLQAISDGELQRLVINIPFRCMKSLLVSVFWPTWTWTIDPPHQFLTLSHAEKLAVRDALKSRRLMRSPWFQNRWGHLFQFTGDQNEKSRYENDKNGHRIALGIKAGVTGEGGDTVLIDDPHDADKAQSDVERESVIDSYDHKIISRLNNQVTGNIVLIMQRLHEKDLAGHVLAEEIEGFEHLCLPMEYDGKRYHSVLGLQDPRTEKNEVLEPIRFPPDVIKRLKHQLGSYGASGQLQQRPSPSEGGILKKPWWRKWPAGKPWPKCSYVLQSWDTAFSDEDFKNNARSARTTWGIFYDEIVGDIEREFGARALGEDGIGGEGFGVILLEAWADHVDYPQLRKEGLKSYRDWKPDAVLIEKKASGQSLIQDMRKAGIPVLSYNPDRDKVSRAYSVQAMLEGGLIFHPDRKWAQDVIDECGMFPNGEFSDYVDTCTQAWIRLRNLHLLEHPDDEEDKEEDELNPKVKEAAYG